MVNASSRLRRRLVLHVERAAASYQRRSAEIAAGRSGGTDAARARLRAGPREHLSDYAIAATSSPLRFRRLHAVDEWSLVPALRADVPDSGRFADRIPVAAGFTALGGARRLSASARAGPPRRSAAVAAAAGVSARRSSRRRPGAADTGEASRRSSSRSRRGSGTRRKASFGRRSVSSPVTADCTFSCRP